MAGIWAAIRNVRPAPAQTGNAAFFKGLELVARNAGVRIWEWDVVHNSMQFSGDLAEVYGAEIAVSEADPDAQMLGKVHPDDRRATARHSSRRSRARRPWKSPIA